VTGAALDNNPSASPQKNPAPQPQATASGMPSLGSARGSVLEIEPVIGPDGETIDFQMQYDVRVPSSEPEFEIDLKGATNVTTRSGFGTVLHAATVPKTRGEPPLPEASRQCAIVVEATYRRLEQELKTELQEQEAHRTMEKLRWEKDLIDRAKAK
jgi:hypothetical protein